MKSLDEYIFEKMKTTQDAINNTFSFIKVNMFETLQNGNISDICEVSANGVPFVALNTASKVNALLDLQNAISKRFNIKLPVFIDNRESTHKIIDTDLQIVNLYHDPEKDFEVV